MGSCRGVLVLFVCLAFIACEKNQPPPILPTNEQELHEVLKAANPDYTGKAECYIENGKFDNITLVDCGIRDLSPLKGLELRALACQNNQIEDLSPLKGMPLIQFLCSDNPVSDLTPLKGMPLWRLHIKNTNVYDLKPLEGMELQEFVFDPGKITRGIDVVRNMKTIEYYFGGEPDGPIQPLISAERFWKLYDEGAFSTKSD